MRPAFLYTPINRSEPKHGGQPKLFVGAGNAPLTWATLSAAYGWRSPYSGYMPGKKTSKIEIVLTSHRNLAMEVDGKLVHVDIPAGGTFTLTEQVATLLRLGEFSDWVAIYVDALVAGSFSTWHPNARPRPPSTFDGHRHIELKPDIRLLSIAHILRGACTGATSISDIEVDTLAHLLVATIWHTPTQDSRRNPLTRAKLDRIFEFVEARLEDQILLSDLAALVAVSPFHFLRSFKLATGLTPYQYVLARRMERAKNLLLTTTLSVREIGWSLGVDNVSHFRRKFIAQFGVRPGEMRPRFTLPAPGTRCSAGRSR
jgi:AraC family transcriptional regulator